MASFSFSIEKEKENKKEQKQYVVMITGGSGLVGTALQEVIKTEAQSNEKWVFLSSRDGDLRKAEDTQKIFQKYQPTHVIHLAAFVGGLFHNMSSPVEFWRYNMAMNENIFWQCKENNVVKLISCLSTCVFPDKTNYPIDETMIHNGPPHSSNEAYAYAKRMIDVQNRIYASQYGCKFTSVIPSNIYGPGDNYNLRDSHVIPGLIHKFYLAKAEGKDMVVMGTGTPLRQFIYSMDLAKLFIWALRNYNSSEPIILSVDESAEVTIRDVVQMISDAIDFKGSIIFDVSKADGQFKKTASNAKLKRLYPEFQFTPIKDGITASVKWFVDNYTVARK